MRFSIDNRIFEKFHGTLVGFVIAKGIDNSGEAPEVISMLRETEAGVKKNFNVETLSQNPRIECWRKAYSAFGGKPKENRSSVENLYRSVLRGNGLRHINKLVDIYNCISLKSMLPAGGEDLDRISGDIALTFAGQNEVPVLLLGEHEARPPHPGEVIYKDGIGTICRRWNWREADRTKLTEETKNCILVIEGLPPVTRDDIELATAELKRMVGRFCGGNTTGWILDNEKPAVEF